MPITFVQHEKRLQEPALCELLPVRDYLDNVIVRTNGSFVAGYELRGLTSYFASDEGRDRGKLMLEALLRSIPEQSMRVRIRYEVVEDVGDLLDQYTAEHKSERDEAIELDRLRVERWLDMEAAGHYMRPLLHAYLIWDPVLHRRLAGKPLKPKGELFSLSARKSIERARQRAPVRRGYPSDSVDRWIRDHLLPVLLRDALANRLQQQGTLGLDAQLTGLLRKLVRFSPGKC